MMMIPFPRGESKMVDVFYENIENELQIIFYFLFKPQMNPFS